MVSIKSKSDIEKMLEAGKIAGEALNVVEQKLHAGMTTKDIDKIVHQVITSHGATPNFLGLYGFPASACVSVNEEVIHGIPGSRRLNEGDIVSVDLGACYKGWNSDTCFTFPVGTVKPEVLKLLEDTNASLYKAIEAAQVGARLGDISHTVEEYCRARGYGIVQHDLLY
jgi:methionyl aminopeptidase